MSDTHHWRHDVLMVLVIVVWGVNYVIVKAALGVMHPHVLNAVRMGFSALALGGVYRYMRTRGEAGLRTAFRRRPARVVLVSLLGYFFYQAAFIVGLDRTLAGSAALIMASSPVWTAVFSSLLGYERIPRAAWLALLVAFSGTVSVVLAGSAEVSFGTEVLVGNLVVLFAAMLWGGYTTSSRPLVNELPVFGFTFLSVAIALPFMAALGAPYAADVEWSRVSVPMWIGIVFSGAFSTGLGVAVWNASVRRIGPAHTAVFSNLTPFVAVLSSWVFLDERIFPAQILGGALILTGLVLMRRIRRRAAPVPLPPTAPR